MLFTSMAQTVIVCWYTIAYCRTIDTVQYTDAQNADYQVFIFNFFHKLTVLKYIS